MAAFANGTSESAVLEFRVRHRATKYTTSEMTLEELEREYVALRQQGEAVRSYL